MLLNPLLSKIVFHEPNNRTVCPLFHSYIGCELEWQTFIEGMPERGLKVDDLLQISKLNFAILWFQQQQSVQRQKK